MDIDALLKQGTLRLLIKEAGDRPDLDAESGRVIALAQRLGAELDSMGDRPRLEQLDKEIAEEERRIRASLRRRRSAVRRLGRDFLRAKPAGQVSLDLLEGGERRTDRNEEALMERVNRHLAASAAEIGGLERENLRLAVSRRPWLSLKIGFREAAPGLLHLSLFLIVLTIGSEFMLDTIDLSPTSKLAAVSALWLGSEFLLEPRFERWRRGATISELKTRVWRLLVSGVFQSYHLGGVEKRLTEARHRSVSESSPG